MCMRIKSEFLINVREEQESIKNKRSEQVESKGGTSSNKRKRKGQNKHRKVTKVIRLCRFVKEEKDCPYGTTCRYSHAASEEDSAGDVCYMFDRFGFCKYGDYCLFKAGHPSNEAFDREETAEYKNEVTNTLRCNSVFSGPKCDYSYPLTSASIGIEKVSPDSSSNISGEVKLTGDDTLNDGDPPHCSVLADSDDRQPPQPVQVKATDDNQFIRNRLSALPSREKKHTVDFRNKLYLAPLTTLGNLPFRRVCVDLGAEVTCSEMISPFSLLQNVRAEWPLTRRHVSEKQFGIQLLSSHPRHMAKAVEIICAELDDVDFIDLNFGCPIDLVCADGKGAAMLQSPRRLYDVIRATNLVSNVPVTAKFRTGYFSSKRNFCEVLPNLAEFNLSLITLHGRTREQRYHRLADWDYIGTCSPSSNVPFFGNGDVMDFEEYYKHLEVSGVDGCLIARGALIKPWIFTEIKERRHWDISANERFDLIKKYVDYGLQHWGSDRRGVETTRRFLLEWLSFLYRYVPVGLLETVPQKINHRPPFYKGRSDLETMLSCSSSTTWIKLSEMLLGKVPDNFTFQPKHVSNAWQANSSAPPLPATSAI